MSLYLPCRVYLFSRTLPLLASSLRFLPSLPPPTVCPTTAMENKTPSALSQREMGTMNTSSLDERAMARIGRVQELKRQFGPLAMIGFAVVLGSTWQAVLADTLFSLGNGGAAGTVYMYIVASFGLMLTTLSLAEMASIAPTAGGQYHWVSELAPPHIQKPLSYFLGWVANYAWQTYTASSAAGLITIIEAVLVFYKGPDYHLTSWQIGLAMILFLTMQSFFNVTLINFLPTVEFILLLLSVGGFFAFELVLLLMGPRGSADDVFLSFNNGNGWSTTGLAVLIGVLNPLVTLTNADSVAHMGEELKDASKWLPRSMILAQIFNLSTAFLMLLTFLFRIGNVNDAVAANPVMPYVAVLANVTKNRGATVFMSLFIGFASGCSTLNQITTASRQLYAFARDGGVPGAGWICKVSSGVPLNAVICTWAFNCVLACIFMGSSIAYNDIASLGVIFLCASYLISISTVLYRRSLGPLPKAQFSLGKFGLPVNIGAVLCLTLFFVLVNPLPTVSLGS